MLMRPNSNLIKVDARGRVVLPPDWRNEELKDSNEVFIIKEKGILKVIPKKKVDLTQFFDTLDIGMNLDGVVGSWTMMEQELLKNNL